MEVPHNCVRKRMTMRRLGCSILAFLTFCTISAFYNEPRTTNTAKRTSVDISISDNRSNINRVFLMATDNRYEFLSQNFTLRKLLESTTDLYDNTTRDQNTTKDATENGKLHISGYPKDLFTKKELRSGIIALHCIAVIYMFIALAITCDEFFVPSLEVIIEKLNISQDVAGATFMAAGGSAPELFTSIIAVFVAHSDVGVGTIVGSAVFNILFVIGMCAMVSTGVLVLTWWPLFRDVTFYSLSLILLIIFFRDQSISWWEALILFTCYIAYVLFMKFNQTIEIKVKTLLGQQLSEESLETVEAAQNGNVIPRHRVTNQSNNSSNSRNSEIVNSKFRQGLLNMLIHTMDPLAETDEQEDAKDRLETMNGTKALKLRQQAQPKPTILVNDKSRCSTSLSLNAPSTAVTTVTNGALQLHDYPGFEFDNAKRLHPLESHGRPLTPLTPVSEVALPLTPPILSDKITNNMNGLSTPETEVSYLSGHSSLSYNSGHSAASLTDNDAYNEKQQKNVTIATEFAETNGVLSPGRQRANTLGMLSLKDLPFNDETIPLDLSWPKSFQKRALYLLLAPIIFPLAITLPDVRNRKRRKFYPWTFLGSIMWIGFYSFLMNWWAATIGNVAGIPDAVMGLTFLAAGTSMPDLITSVIVAKKGYGDMAISSSVGSNIFDVTVGLPLPWLFYGIIFQEPYDVNSTGMLCSVVLLFAMLIIIIITIAAFKWQMNKGMGIAMFFLYALFLCLSLLLVFDEISCPEINV